MLVTPEHMESIPALVNDALVIFADLQDDIVPRQQTMKAKKLRKNAAALAKIAKVCELPIIVSVVARGDAAPKLIAELAEALGDVRTFPRTSRRRFRRLPPNWPATFAANAGRA